MGVVSDAILAGEAGAALFQGPAVLEIDEVEETVPAPIPDAGVGALTVCEQAAVEIARQTRGQTRPAWRISTFTARLLLICEGRNPGRPARLESNRGSTRETQPGYPSPCSASPPGPREEDLVGSRDP